MPRVRSKNQCSCCKKSSSSERPSSTDPSYDPPSSSKDPSSGDPSSDDPSSSSSQKSSYNVGKCCAIPTDYIVASEIYPSNEFDEAEAWIRSQRNGREGVGFLFHGPIRLRFDGGWFVAVICVGKLQDDGTCECNEYNDPDSYTCEETDDPGYCYYLSGIPGLGVFTENSGCNCNGSGSGEDGEEPCDDCSGTFEECEIGCTESGCGCCYEEAPPATEDGVACSKRFMVLDNTAIQELYPEIVQDTDCTRPEEAKDGSVLQRMVDDLVNNKNILRTSINVASFRDECRIEVWGECDCSPEVNCDGPCEEQCYDKDAVGVDFFDEWQAGQLGMEWKSKDVDGECPEACIPPGYACIYPCYKGMLPGCQGFDTEAEAIACVSFENPEQPGYSWPQRGYLPIAVECSPGSWQGAIVCCYACAGPLGQCLVCLSGTGNPEFPQGQDAVREDDWENDIVCQSFDSEDLANKQSCQEQIAYKEVLAWYTEDEAPEGCETEGICDGPWDEEQNRKFDQAIERALKRKEMNTRTKGGAGTELTKLLKFFGIESTEKGCKCKSRAAKMDKNGIEWCSNNIEKICNWLQEESQKRKLPFLRTAARVIVLRAIRNARKAEEV